MYVRAPAFRVAGGNRQIWQLSRVTGTQLPASFSHAILCFFINKLGIYHATVAFIKTQSVQRLMFGICRVLTRMHACRWHENVAKTAYRIQNGWGGLSFAQNNVLSYPNLTQGTTPTFQTSCLAQSWSAKLADIVVTSSNIQLARQPDTRTFCWTSICKIATQWYLGTQCHRTVLSSISLTVAPRASTSTSPSIASHYILDDIDATSTLVGESAMTSPSLSSNETISLPDETNETDATATPSSISSKKSRLHPQKREMSETNRRINLEKDLYTTGVQSKSVQCTECLREIRFVDYNIIAATCAFDVDPTFSLDKRWQYYDYPWRKTSSDMLDDQNCGSTSDTLKTPIQGIKTMLADAEAAK